MIKEIYHLDEYTIHWLAGVFAKKYTNSINYVSGPDLVKFFQKLGFKDSYSYEDDIGIIEENGDKSISRIKYATDRLSVLNKRGKIDSTLKLFIEKVNDKNFVRQEINSVLSSVQVIDTEKKSIQSVAKNLAEATTKEKRFMDAQNKSLSFDDKSKMSQREFIEDTILGKIPTNRPVVFISYSWDSVEHKAWVKKFADDLSNQGVFVLLDEYEDYGIDLPLFMEHGINRAEKVLIVGTNCYKKKCENAQSGVSFEENIIYNAFYQKGVNLKKFIPCLRQGSFTASFPSMISGKKGFNFSNQADYDSELKRLCENFRSEPNSKRPKLGDSPDHTKKE